MRTSKTRADHLETLARRTFVFELRRTGATYAMIVQTMRQHATWNTRLPKSYNERKAHEDVMRTMERIQTELGESVQVVRQQELDRLDRMLLGVWSRAQQGDDRAITSVLGIMARRARYLPGLEAPQAIAPTTPDGLAPYTPFGEAEITDEYVRDVAGLLAQYGLYQLDAAADTGAATPLATHGPGDPPSQ